MWWLTSGILLVSVLAACAPSGTAPAAPPQAPPRRRAPRRRSRAAAAPAKPELEPIQLEVGLPATTAFTWPFLVIRDGPIGAQERMTLDCRSSTPTSA